MIHGLIAGVLIMCAIVLAFALGFSRSTRHPDSPDSDIVFVAIVIGIMAFVAGLLL